MSAYKLVVVFPFGNYQRGHTIYDQKIIDEIFDIDNKEMHQLKQNVRRVLLSELEAALALQPAQEIVQEEIAPPAPQEILLSSVAADEQPPVEDHPI